LAWILSSMATWKGLGCGTQASTEKSMGSRKTWRLFLR